MARFLWTKELIIKEALKYKTVKIFRENNASAYAVAYRNHWLKEACAHMIKEKNRNTKWTKELVAIEAKKHQYKIDFKKAQPGAYRLALKSGWMEELCNHMPQKMKPRNFKWDKQSIAAAAKQHTLLSEFTKQNGGAYKTAITNGWDKELFAHLEYKTVSSNDVIYIWQAKELTFNGLPVYKIGITSERRGDGRIKKVAHKAKLTAEIITLTKVKIKASNIEKQLHQLGHDPKLNKIDGYTEFRAMNNKQLNQALNIITKYAA